MGENTKEMEVKLTLDPDKQEQDTESILNSVPVMGVADAATKEPAGDFSAGAIDESMLSEEE